MKRAAAQIALCGVIGLVLPILIGLVLGVPEPLFHDEFSYLLGADTLARGRLANPPPPLPEFFEAPHILVSPTYATKYPPGQPAILAIGEILFDRPIWGVWISCGLFAAALCWTLQAWVRGNTAVQVTIAASITLGTVSYWAQSYWGGMLAATGGALVIGAVQRTLRAPRIATTVMLGSGLLILVNTRPYEGILTAVIPVCVAVRSLAARGVSWRSRVVSFGLPLAASLVITAAMMSSYNRAVTGDPREFPYQLHVKQYLPEGLLIFSASRQPSRHPTERVRRIYQELLSPPVRGFSAAGVAARNFVQRSIETFAAALGAMSLPIRGRQPFAGITVWVVLLVCQLRRSARFVTGFALLTLALELLAWWSLPAYPLGLAVLVTAVLVVAIFHVGVREIRWLLASVLLLLVVQSLVHWWAAHYVAPAVPAILVVIAVSLERLSIGAAVPNANRAGLNRTAVTTATLLALYAATVIFVPAIMQAATDRPARGTPTTRSEINNVLQSRGQRHLVFVAYDPQYTVHSEWVYNPADLGSAPIIYAHDLGDARNRALISAFGDRTVWRAHVSDQVDLVPYPTK